MARRPIAVFRDRIMDEVFGRYHPAVNFIFFIGAIVLGMFFVHPLFLIISVVLSLIYYLLIKGTKGIRFLLGMLILFAVISLVNPLFNTAGDRVMFTYCNGRCFTLEALYYGFAIGGMFLSVILWFACYNAVMTSDKFIYMFGRLMPAVSLLLSMVLRLVPSFKKEVGVIWGVRKCIGKSPANGNKKEKLRHAMDILSVLTSWSLEGAVITADSMKSRGYGSGKRSSFAIYRLCARDVIVLATMLVSIVTVMMGMLGGATRVTYIPVLDIPEINGYTIAGITGYTVFLSIPSIIHIGEEIKWRILRSRI